MIVIIDGVEYVPVMEANADMEAIARGLMYQFWGEIGRHGGLEEKMEGLRVRVQDDGMGEPIKTVLADIARKLREKQT